MRYPSWPAAATRAWCRSGAASSIGAASSRARFRPSARPTQTRPAPARWTLIARFAITPAARQVREARQAAGRVREARQAPAADPRARVRAALTAPWQPLADVSRQVTPILPRGLAAASMGTRALARAIRTASPTNFVIVELRRFARARSAGVTRIVAGACALNILVPFRARS
jgi:hypothetical protein